MKLKAFKLAEVLFRQINLVDIEFLECLVSQNDKSTLNEAMDIARRMLEEDSTNETIISLYIRYNNICMLCEFYLKYKL